MGRNFVTEYISTPSKWSLEDERYDWLTERDRENLRKFPFDFGDILDAENHFCSPKQTCDLLMCSERDLDTYCQILWRKPWEVVHQALYAAARNDAIDDVFMPYAKDGHPTAMSILTSHIMRMQREDADNALKIKIVNDLDDEDS